MTEHVDRIGLGGGCHWCTEGIFRALRGVGSVEQGYIRSAPPADTWAEAIMLDYDSRLLDLPALLDVHVHSHDAALERQPASKYRSAIYVLNVEQRAAVEQALAQLKHREETVVRTQVLPLIAFRPSDDRVRDFYRRYPDRAFSKRYIDPRLERLRSDFPGLILPTT